MARDRVLQPERDGTLKSVRTGAPDSVRRRTSTGNGRHNPTVADVPLEVADEHSGKSETRRRVSPVKK